MGASEKHEAAYHDGTAPVEFVDAYRDAISGEYVTKEYAEANPDTTVKETTPITPTAAEQVTIDLPLEPSIQKQELHEIREAVAADVSSLIVSLSGVIIENGILGLEDYIDAFNLGSERAFKYLRKQANGKTD